jgi:radical SAM superfamily enzyme YgiQ (UPF0313 family)
MSDVVLTTLNARYAHASFGLRYLMANLGPELSRRATMLEFEVKQPVETVAGKILAHDPKVVGVGVYIWNVAKATELVAELKKRRPDVKVVIGGPEVSYELDRQEIVRFADHVVTGEADLAFADLCAKLLGGRPVLTKIVRADLPAFTAHGAGAGADARVVRLPYDLYDADDVAHRVIYVEASRGCPFKCEFCLSSLDVPVRNVPTDAFLASMQGLLDRGVRRFKFVDRTFNLNLNISASILRFFLERLTDDLFLHFEMIPDRLPEALRALIKQFPAGALQFEVGIQTFNDDVSALISRKQDATKVEDNLRWLRAETGVHVHADLIVGLPGEDVASFARGFDRLVALGPQEIQVGMLKRLRGTPIVRHDETWGMVYDESAPYEVRQTKLIGGDEMARMKRFARFWDLVANNGNFVETTRLILSGTLAFASFMSLCDRLYAKIGRTHAIPLSELAEQVFRYGVDERGFDQTTLAQTMWRDWRRGGRGDRPRFLRDHINDDEARMVRGRSLTNRRSRQARHLAPP